MKINRRPAPAFIAALAACLALAFATAAGLAGEEKKEKKAQEETAIAKPNPQYSSRPNLLSDGSWKGRPGTNFAEGSDGYFVWVDDGGWHVRWATKGKKAAFTGSVEVDGNVQEFQAVQKDKKDTIKKTRDNEVTWNATAHDGVDGFDFRLSKSVNYLTFILRQDGRPAQRDRVKLGEKKKNPGGVPFTIDRRRDAVKDKDKDTS